MCLRSFATFVQLYERQFPVVEVEVSHFSSATSSLDRNVTIITKGVARVKVVFLCSLKIALSPTVAIDLRFHSLAYMSFCPTIIRL